MIKVLHKAMNVLECVSRVPEGLPLSAIAAAIGEKATTTSNIVQVLAKRNYLERVDGKWKLGIGAYLLTGSTLDYDRTVALRAEPLLRELADRTKTTAVLSVWRGNERYVILRVSDGSAVTVNRTYPEAREIYGTATGILLLSAQDDAVIDAHIAAHGIPDNPAPTPEQTDAFREMLKACRRRGYFYRETADVFEAAAPVRYRGVRTAVGIFLPRFRLENKEETVAELLKITEGLEEALNALAGQP